MSIIENPSNFIYYGIKYKKLFKKEELKFKWGNNQISDLKYEIIGKDNLDKEDSTIVFYFQKNSDTNILEIINKNKQIKETIMSNFLFNIKLLNYSEIELSDYEQFKIYKQFIDIISPSSIELKQLLYDNCRNGINLETTDFILILELIDYYKGVNNKIVSTLFSSIPKNKNQIINKVELFNNKERYLKLIKEYQSEKYNISKFKSDNNLKEKGIVIMMIYLYICLDFNKFMNYYSLKFDKKIKKCLQRIKHLKIYL